MNKKQHQQFRNALKNTIDKSKAYIRNNNQPPGTAQFLEWLQSIAAAQIHQDKPALTPLVPKPQTFEAILFLNSESIYISFKYQKGEYRSRPHLTFQSDIQFLSELDPADDMDEELLSYLKKAFDYQ